MNNLDLNEIVKVEQLPKIFFQLEQIGLYIDENLKDIDKLECTEENKQEVKKRRTEINNTLKILEDNRKEVKKSILEPYKLFEEKYEQECKDKLENASELLSNKINIIEQEQYIKKRNELAEFFNQYKETYHLDFLNFEDVDLNITLTVSMKSLKDQIKDFCETINRDIQIINNDEFKEEIMFEFQKNHFDYGRAKLTVLERHKKQEELKQQMEQKQEIEKQEQQVVEKVQEIMPPKEILQDEELLEITFKIKANKTQIRNLKQFLDSEGIEYE